ncbi:hypothetical protein Tco_0542722 [Tanacetum coccineum]
MSGYILHVHSAQSQTSSVPEQQYQLYLAMKADPQLQQQDIAIWLAFQMKFERNTLLQTACRTPAVRPRDQDDPHDDAHPEGENSAKQQKTSEYEAYVSRESSSGQAFQEEQAPTKQVSQDIMEEVSLTIDEAKLRKMADEMLRQRCTSGDEHQYHIDQMKNFLKSDIVWESRKEILVSPHPRKTTPLVHSCQKDLEVPALSLINQDLLYLKKKNSGPEKIVNEYVKKFNPYARYGVEHWKNPHAKIFYIRKQKEPGKSKEEIYLNSKIVQVIKTYWELGHEHKFITEIVARRANDCIVPDYADTGLLWSLLIFIRSTVIWEIVHDFQLGIESYQQKVNLTAPTMTFLGIEDHEMFSIIYEPVHGIIYKNSKKEKRVMRHSEIHKFCDATLNRVLEGLKSYNNDVKYGYVQKDLTKEEAEYLKLFEEEIEERLKHRRQMRRWEMKPKRVKDSTYHKEKILLCKQAEKGVQLQAEQSDWLADTDEEIDEQELEAHYSYMEKIQEVPNADSCTDSEPLEHVQYDTGYNVFANEIQHFEQFESISNICAVETVDSNVIPDLPDMCDNDIQNDKNDVECDDERVALANLIANLKLDVDENKKIQKQLKKANASLTQELKECKSTLAETSRTLGESNSIRDSCLVALQNKQTEFERYKAFNDRTIDYDKLERKLNKTLGLLAQKDIDIKEGLKVKSYEIFVVKEKHDELVK